MVIVAGTAKKRFTTQEMARRFALFEEALFFHGEKPETNIRNVHNWKS